ncbi:MAG: tetratricopeptide repeat protein [Planctomycetia bacterium]
MTRGFRSAVLLLTAGVGLTTSTASAAETLKLTNGITITGDVVGYDARGVAIRLPSKEVKSYEHSRIASLEARYTVEQEAGLQAMRTRDYATAAAQFKAALAVERREWVKGRLDALLLDALKAADRWTEAAEAFFVVTDARTDADVMAAAPLSWIPGRPPTAEALAAARRWLDQNDRPMAQLIAASWLLESPADVDRAVLVLDSLQTLPEQRVGWIARAQLWRVRDPMDDAGLDRMAAFIEKVPEAIRGGPHYALGLVYERRGKPLDAALSFLWVPLVDEAARPSPLAADALVRAGKASLRAGLADDGRRILREAVAKYPDTPWAAQAAEALAAADAGKPAKP